MKSFSKLATFKKGAYIIKEADISNEVYQIISGSVEILKRNQQGKEVVIAILKEEDVIGELGIIQDRNRESSVRAFTDVELRVIDIEIFDLLEDDENYTDIMLIISALAERVRDYGNKLIEYGIVNSTGKVKGEIYNILIKPISENAENSLGDFEKIVVDKLPYKVGRFSRKKSDKLFHKNNFYLFNNEPYSISRSHFIITEKNGEIFFKDNGSKTGSKINGVKVDRNNLYQKLNIGTNLLILGKEKDNFVYEIVVSSA